MDGMDHVRSGDEPYMQVDNLKLRNYFPHEIEKLSVLRITQTKTFDSVGHPVRGGLYDPVLGPTNPRDRCETCNQFEVHCPGHIGHLVLDVPVFSPMLYSFTFNLLKGTCVQCHRLTCKSNGAAAKIFLAQLRCFELGAPQVALDMEAYIKDLMGGSEFEICAEDEAQEAKLVDEMIAKVVTTTPTIAQRPTKNSVDLKKKIFRNFLRDNLFKRKERCPLCKQRNGKIANDGARCIILNFATGKQSGKKVGESIYNPEELEIDEAWDEEKKDDDENIGYGGLDSSVSALEIQLQAVKEGTCDKLAWRAAEVREHFRMVYKNDGEFLKKIFSMLADESAGNLCPLDGLFTEHILVPSTKFRPIRLFKGERYEDPQTVNLRKVLEASETIKAISLLMRGEKSAALSELVASRIPGKTINAKLHNAYLQLQLRANCIFDETLDNTANKDARAPGIKQILEKKQGLFRMNMMGKRVNYACRSVITPDPYLDIDEIGIPEVFAKKLTFTEHVNLYNCQSLKKLVLTGPKVHPGANYVYQGNRRYILGDQGQDEYLKRKGHSDSLKPAGTENIRNPMKVLRHLRKGDMMMMNRQPSLHKPSIMGHRARILKGQRALRMNYAPCKAYNADFDGDEMNGHLVQTYMAQCEVADIASVGANLLVPKDATPLLGLIQDHVVSGVLLTMRGRFLNKEDFMHLVLAAFGEQSSRIEMPPPAMIKPQVLWSGKQVITCILKNSIPKSSQLINLSGKAKTPLSCWKVRGFPTPKFDMSESEVVFRDGELLVGVLDKAHYGATQFGLAHCCFELYGPKVGVKVLSCFSRLFTTYLQFHGFTLGVADILVRAEANDDRRRAIMESRTIGDQVVRNVFNLDDNCSSAEIKRVLASTYCNPKGQGTDVKMLDFGMKQGVAKYNDAINQACVPEGLIRSFPENALQMMIQSGAKGSAVNAMQISCGLGQIELEGKRMAVTIAGRTLPSFRAFDPSPRAGGYIDQRFLTGINPQELFFHTMAGREGLIDTAVKTSRSGYLQRCIIKHLEGIKVHYDSTVRDHDGSIIQFRYGEDGLDTCKSTFLGEKTLKFLGNNLEAVNLTCKPDGVQECDFNVDDTEMQYEKIKDWREWKKRAKPYRSGFTEFSDEHQGTPKKVIQDMWYNLTTKERRKMEKQVNQYEPRPVDEKFDPNITLGALPEKTLDMINKCVDEDNAKLKRTLFWKGMRSRVEPGENVGLLAAQSIGEPSTQMTLNTFHFAGRGEMNVTLGIPRLREILMTASKNIATPSAQIAILPGTSRERIDQIRQQLDRVYLKQVLKRFTVTENVNITVSEIWRRYSIRFEILESAKREQGAQYLKKNRIMNQIEEQFINVLCRSISKKLQLLQNYQQMHSRKMVKGNVAAGLNQDKGESSGARGAVDDGASSDEEADGGKEADAAETRLNRRHNDEAAEYEGEDEDRGEIDQVKEVEPEGEENDEEDENDEAKVEKATDDRQESVDARVRKVFSHSSKIVGYKFDTSKNNWCELTLEFSLTNQTKLDLHTIIEQEIEKCIIAQTPGIERCIETVQQKDGVDVTYIQTQGVNLQALFEHSDALDVNSVYSNDLNLVLNQYGVEACAKAIVTEMNNVFAVYGIEVSRRHLSLTADHMTFTGEIAPFNRGAMAASASPLQKMTFETTMAFMKETLLHGEEDTLESPSSRLVLGSLNRGGTGAFDLFMNLPEMERGEGEDGREMSVC